jgi:hypothetical protein
MPRKKWKHLALRSPRFSLQACLSFAMFVGLWWLLRSPPRPTNITQSPAQGFSLQSLARQIGKFGVCLRAGQNVPPNLRYGCLADQLESTDRANFPLAGTFCPARKSKTKSPDYRVGVFFFVERSYFVLLIIFKLVSPITLNAVRRFFW